MLVLPFELERAIFELTLRSDPENAFLKLNLSLVARRVQAWVDLIFYKLVTISRPKSADTFLSLIALKPYGFFARTVKALCLAYAVKTDQACGILSACTGVEVLACWVNQQGCQDLPLLLSRLPLRHLSIEFKHLLNVPHPPAWLSNLTHIDLVLWDVPASQSRTSSLCQRLPVLPRLTHLAISSSDTDFALYAKAACSRCPSLEVLAIMDTYSEKVLAKACSFNDARIVLIDDEFIDPVGNWEATSFGGVNVWSLAEDILRQRAT